MFWLTYTNYQIQFLSFNETAWLVYWVSLYEYISDYFITVIILEFKQRCYGVSNNTCKIQSWITASL